jgi:hypothetical protein
MKVTVVSNTESKEEFEYLEDRKETCELMVDQSGGYSLCLNEEVYRFDINDWESRNECGFKVRKLNKGEVVTIKFEGT